MTDDHNDLGGQTTGGDDLVEIDLNFESMRRFQAEFSPNLSKGGLFIDTGEPLSPGSVVRFRVILPEEFVFLEGTGVVEWMRRADAVCDGAPGMAVRFVTLSLQNQELVEQLVQDFVDVGGTPFDLDVQPAPADFPTDSLEGASTPSKNTSDEGYRLTVRHTGPDLQADALQSRAEVVPDDDEADLPTEAEDGVPISDEMDAIEIDAPLQVEEKAVSVEDAHGFEIVSSVAAELIPAVEETAIEVEPVPAVEETAIEFEPVPAVEETAIEFEPVPAVEEAAIEVEAVPAVEEAAIEVEAVPAVEETAIEVGAVPAVEEAATEVEAVAAAEETVDAVETIGDPPGFDWSAELDTLSEPVEVPPVEETVVAVESELELPGEREEIRVAEQDELSFPVDGNVEPAATDEVSLIEDYVEIPDVLPTPPAFDDGPEVIDDVDGGDLGSPAFDVSLPDHDDEPDNTPVLPDEGRDDFTVDTDDDFDEPPRRRRRWPLPLAAILVLAVGGGFLWPHARNWLSSRDATPAGETVGVESTGVVEEAMVPAAEQPPTDPVVIPQSSDDGVAEAQAGDDDEAVVVEIEEPEAVVETVVEEVEPESTQASAQLGTADAVTAVDFEPGGTGTVIRIRANGSLEDGVLSMETLSSPPRVLIRVRGITSSYRPYTIEAMTTEVTQIRSGLHEERRPPELWIVVDLAEPDVAMSGVSIRRDLAELLLARP